MTDSIHLVAAAVLSAAIVYLAMEPTLLRRTPARTRAVDRLVPPPTAAASVSVASRRRTAAFRLPPRC